jgi:hypothetical protein
VLLEERSTVDGVPAVGARARITVTLERIGRVRQGEGPTGALCFDHQSQGRAALSEPVEEDDASITERAGIRETRIGETCIGSTAVSLTSIHVDSGVPIGQRWWKDGRGRTCNEREAGEDDETNAGHDL